MGLGTNILIITVCISFCFWLYGNGTGHPEYGGIFSTFLAGTPLTGLQTAFMAIVGVFVAASIIAGSLIFPNPYSVFAPMIVGFVALATFPIDVINSTLMPTEIKVLLTTVFGLLYFLAMLAFYHGSAEF